MNKRPSNHVLAQSGASLYILVICMVTLLTSCVSREQHQFESLRDFAVEFAEADTAAFAAQWKERVKSIKLDTPPPVTPSARNSPNMYATVFIMVDMS